MDQTRIEEAANAALRDYHVVWWSDLNGEFEELAPDLDIGDATFVPVADTSSLDIKFRIRSAPIGTQFLLYEGKASKSVDGLDWLKDVRLFARRFKVDRASQIADSIKIEAPVLKEHIKTRLTFFNSKKRLDKITQHLNNTDDPAGMDRKIMATLLGIERSDIAHIVIGVFGKLKEPDLWEERPDILAEFDKFSVMEVFWSEVAKTYGYVVEKPALETFLRSILVSDFTYRMNGKTPASLRQHCLEAEFHPAIIVLLGMWRDSRSSSSTLDRLSADISESTKIRDLARKLDITALRETFTFEAVEREIIAKVRDVLIDTESSPKELEGVLDIIQFRKQGHWVNSLNDDNPSRIAFRHMYGALTAAANLLKLRKSYDLTFNFPNAEAFWKSYAGDLYCFDQLYRHFIEAADAGSGQDFMKELRSRINDVYDNDFVSPASARWSEHVTTMLDDRWAIPDVCRQDRFYAANVAPILERSKTARAVVIVSDAFRYEIAKEFVDGLNTMDRYAGDIEPMLGVVPSCTAIGMASLLPPGATEMTGDGLVTIDGKATSGIENRKKVLAQHGGTAVNAEDLMAMSKDDGRTFIGDHRLVYVYHNHIDSTADAGDEARAFQAARGTIDFLSKLCQRVLGSYNGTNVFVTADHGFMYREGKGTESGRTAVDPSSNGSILNKRRYKVGFNMQRAHGTIHGALAKTSRIQGKEEFLIPRGTDLFHYQGGSRFMHGGAMLQEIVVPCVRVQYVKSKDTKLRAKRVELAILKAPDTITTPRPRISLMQTEGVSERSKVETVTVAIYDGNELMSDIQTISFESKEPSHCSAWTQDVVLTMQNAGVIGNRPLVLKVRRASDRVDLLTKDVYFAQAIERDF